MKGTEFQFSTYLVTISEKEMGPLFFTRHMASDGTLSACGDTKKDAERMLLIVRKRHHR